MPSPSAEVPVIQHQPQKRRHRHSLRGRLYTPALDRRLTVSRKRRPCHRTQRTSWTGLPFPARPRARILYHRFAARTQSRHGPIRARWLRCRTFRSSGKRRRRYSPPSLTQARRRLHHLRRTRYLVACSYRAACIKEPPNTCKPYPPGSMHCVVNQTEHLSSAGHLHYALALIAASAPQDVRWCPRPQRHSQPRPPEASARTGRSQVTD